MKNIKLVLTALVLTPALSHADIPAGLWEVIGYPKNVQVTAKPKSATIDFSKDENTVDYADNTMVMNVCIVADGTWYEVNYGNQHGGWSITGSNLTFSGNNESIGSSGVLSVVDPNGTMAGDWQQWPLTAPATQQDVFSSSWAFKNASCS